MTASPTPTPWTVDSTDHHAWAKEFLRRGLGPEMLETWFKNAMQAARNAVIATHQRDLQQMRDLRGNSVIPMLLDDGTSYVCSSMAGGARSTDGAPNHLVLTIARPGRGASQDVRYVQEAIVADHQKMIHGYRLAHTRLTEARAAGALTDGSWLDRIAVALTGESMAPEPPPPAAVAPASEG